VRVALAQVDVRLGEVEENAARARRAIEEAQEEGADLVVFPELQLSGYALEGTDNDTSLDAADAAEVAGDACALVCFHERDGERRFNSAAFVAASRIVHLQRKVYLPSYAPFSEGSLFSAGDGVGAFDTPLGRVATLICNDAWQPLLPSLAAQQGAELLLMPAASSTKMPEVDAYWRDLTRFYARFLSAYVVFVNRVGRDGTFTFWGGSHVVDPFGRVVGQAPRDLESLVVCEVDLERVRARRRELPLLGELRPALLRAAAGA
jgi:predicted amidohydrolase